MFDVYVDQNYIQHDRLKSKNETSKDIKMVEDYLSVSYFFAFFNKK